MNGRKQLVLRALHAAARCRAQQTVAADAAICIYDLSERLGVDVRFEQLPSMEGVYLRLECPVILVSSLRPLRRRRFTCAHELGHHIFGHGSRYDAIVDDRKQIRANDPDELLADSFAAALLMPKTTIASAFHLRGYSTASPTAIQVYAVAGWLGVGFNTLIYQMDQTYRLMEPGAAAALRRHRPIDIRSELLGMDCPHDVLIVDQYWKHRAVDVEVGDRLLLPPACKLEGTAVRIDRAEATRSIAEATSPGISRLVASKHDWATYVRVSRASYSGLAAFRFDEDQD
jgi:IrrE N-terminal-like domain